MSDHDLEFLRNFVARNGVERVTALAPASDEETETVLICCTVGDPEHVDAVERGPCDGGCGEEIFWSKASPPVTRRLCRRCAALRIAKSAAAGEELGPVKVTDAIADEVEAVLGRALALGNKPS